MGSFTHTAFDTDLGLVALAATSQGVVRCDLPGSDPDALVEEVIARTGLEPSEGGRLVDEAADQLLAYMAGDRQRFDLDLDWRLIGGFHRQVLKATARIPYGRTVSYGEVAAMAGRPGAARAAGTALSRNPIALIVPCHRVIRADGSIGGFGGGANSISLKKHLLALEQS